MFFQYIPHKKNSPIDEAIKYIIFSFILFCFCRKISTIYSSCRNRISHQGIIIFPCVIIVLPMLIVGIYYRLFRRYSVDIFIFRSKLIHNSFHNNHSFLPSCDGNTHFVYTDSFPRWNRKIVKSSEGITIAGIPLMVISS